MSNTTEQPGLATLDGVLRQVAALRQAGRLAETVPLLEHAVALAPTDADVRNDLGLTLVHLGQAPRALTCFEAALAVAPQHARALLNRGKVLEQLGRPGYADAYKRAVEADPTLAEAQARLASVLEQAGQRGAARTHYQQAAALAPAETAAGQLYRTRVAMTADTLAASEQELRALLAGQPDAPATLAMLGRVLSVRGDFAAAEEAFEQALRSNPAEIVLYFDLVRTRRIGPADGALIARMRQALEQPAPVPARLRLLLALAKALDDCTDYGGAAAALREAGTLRATHFPLNRPALRAHTDRCITLFTPAFLARPGHKRTASTLPVLVLGLPRSGTTLVERILGRHPAIAGAGELSFWEQAGPALLGTLQPNADANLTAQGEAYVARLRHAATHATALVVDKNPLNFRWALLAHLALPIARIIHCRRGAADNALSNMLAALQPQPLFSSAPDD